MPDAVFPYPLAACDLDGTLLGPQKKISDANRAAVRSLQARGTRIVVASGRRHQNSLRYYRELALDGLLISCAGALVKDPDSGQTVREALLSADLAAELVSRGQADGLTVIYYHRDHLYIDARNHWTDLYEFRVGERAEMFPGDLQELQGAAALKIVWYGDPAGMPRTRQRVEKEYRDRVRVLATDPENLEFSAPGADKADALAAAAAYYGVPQAETLAFGDGENDVPMLRWAGLGVAMASGSETAKSAAALVGPIGEEETSFARAVDAVYARVNPDHAG